MDMCALCFPQPQRGKTARQYICRPIFAFSLSALLVFLNGFPSSELISSVFICLVFALLVSTYIVLLFASLLNISYLCKFTPTIISKVDTVIIYIYKWYR